MWPNTNLQAAKHEDGVLLIADLIKFIYSNSIGNKLHVRLCILHTSFNGTSEGLDRVGRRQYDTQTRNINYTSRATCIDLDPLQDIRYEQFKENQHNAY
jgi:hypothetical protein